MTHDITKAVLRPDWLDDTVWPFTVHTHLHDKRPIHYIDEGTGPVVVFIHAGLWSFVWRDLIARLSTNFRCLALDYPGAGLTPGTRDEVDLEAYVGLTTDWLDDLGISDAVYVVHDLGGVVGINAAARRAGTVNGVVAINSFAWPPHTPALRGMLRIMGGPMATRVLGSMRVIPRLSRGRFGVGRQLDKADRQAFYGPYRQRRAAGQNFHRVMGSSNRSRELFGRAQTALRGDLAGTPALLVFGENNDPFGFEAIWREHFPDAVSHVVKGGNHFPMCDDPDAVASWFREWHGSHVAITR